MDTSSGGARGDVVLRLTVPAIGDLRAIASALAVKIAEFLGTRDAVGAAGAIERLARDVAAGDAPIEFVFRKVDGDLLIEARGDGRASEARHPLPA